MNKKYLIIGIIIIIVIAIGFYIIGFASGKKASQSEILQYKKALDYHTLAQEEIFSISGEIKEINNKNLSIEAKIEDSYKSPEDWEIKIIKVYINESTEITKINPEAGLEEEGFFIINFSDLKTGDIVTATSKENIKNKTDFTASVINVFNTAK